MKFPALFRQSAQYTPIKNASDHDQQIYRGSEAMVSGQTITATTTYEMRAPQRHSWHLFCFLWLNLTLFMVSVMLFLSPGPRRPQYVDHSDENMRNSLLKQLGMPSPMLDEIDIRVEPKRMDGTLLNRDPPAIYRQDPSPEVDKAWADLYDTRPVPVTREQVLAIGKDPDTAIRVPSSWGVGEDMYFARLDIYHQLHCLDAIRREVHFDYYYREKYPGGYNSTTEKHKLHFTHCLWMIAQNIMCSGNTDIYTHIWTDTLDHGFPDFNIEHKCKDFSAIRDWQNQNALNEKDYVELRRPAGYPYSVMTHKFKEIHNFFDFHDDDGDYDSGEIA